MATLVPAICGCERLTQGPRPRRSHSQISGLSAVPVPAVAIRTSARGPLPGAGSRICKLSQATTPRKFESLSLRRRSSTNMSSKDISNGVAPPKLAFLGIGIMGLAMARNLLKAGYEVTVWNRSADKCEPLAAEGATVASTAKEAIAAADITIAMLSDPPAALAVAEDAVAGLSPGKGYVDASTVDAQTAQQIAELVHGAGAEYLEAPVSGSKGPAEQGTLIFLTGGDQALFERSRPLLDVMGKAKFFLGQVGNGANMKLVVNMMMGSFMAASAEGLSLARAVGLQQRDVIDVVALGAIATPMFALKAPAMVEGRYPTAFPLKHQQKDMRLALERARQGGLQLPVAAAANDLYKEAQAKGFSNADFSAVLESVQKT